MRRKTAFLVIGLIAALSLAAAACGSDDDGDDDDSGAQVDLAIRIWPHGEDAGEPVDYTLTCLPAEGSLPDAAAACEQLGGVADPFAPVPGDAACTEIYGGPQEAHVTGSFGGESIDARFSRENGCEIARWDAVGLLFPVDLNDWGE